MSTYVISDIHGEYELLRKMLEKICFCDEDILYVLGDMIDRGPEPMKVLLELMGRDNVYPICGNHELMAYACLSFLNKEITDESIKELEDSMFKGLQDWMEEGGDITLQKYMECDFGQKEAVLEYLLECMERPYELLKVNGRKYILVHAGLGNFSPDKDMDEYSLTDLTCTRTDYAQKYFDDITVITGHTPTQIIFECDNRGFIYKGNGHIAIDCGACSENGRLAAIRLEDEMEYYVEKEA